MKLACLQMRASADQLQNANDFEALVREAAAAGAGYVQSPEMTGLIQRNRAELSRAIRKPEDTPVVQRADALSKELQIVVHIGSTAVQRQDGKYANRAFVFVPGAAKPTTYDKIHMFDAKISATETWRESSVYVPGEKAVMVKLNAEDRLGLGICYDLRFPALFRDYAIAGCHILTAPAAFTVPTGKAHWQTLVRARAIENGAYMVCAAQGGEHEDGRVTFGHSMIVDPLGNAVSLTHDEPGILYASYDRQEVDGARSRIPVLENERLFKTVGRNPKPSD